MLPGLYNFNASGQNAIAVRQPFSKFFWPYRNLPNGSDELRVRLLVRQ